MCNLKKIILATFFLCSISIIFAQETKVGTAKSVLDVLKTSTGTADTLQKIAIEQKDSTKVKYWKISGAVGLNGGVTGLWNWAAGGNNNATAVVFGNLRLTYQKKKYVWETFFDTDFGYTWLDKNKYAWRKSNDKIIFTTKAGYAITKKLYLTALAGFRSQYARGYIYPDAETEDYISNWLSPSYTDISVGVDWKPNKIFSLYYSPAAGRITTTLDTIDNNRMRYKYLGSDTKYISNGFKTEFGMSAKAMANYQYKSLKVLSVLTFFTPYNKHCMSIIDVDWDLSVTYQFLKVLNVSLGTTLKYYDAILFEDSKQHIQFKTVLGVGVGYTF